jgi:hypothetical protein
MRENGQEKIHENGGVDRLGIGFEILSSLEYCG